MTRRLARITMAASVAAAGVLVLAPAAAPGATQTIGSALTLPYQGGVCNNNCLSVQLQQAGGSLPHPITSPANGVITEWKVRTGDPDAFYTLRVLTPAANNAYIATTSVQAPAPVPAGTVDSILTYPGNNAPIKFGQAIGILQTMAGGAGADVGLPQNTTNGITTNVISNLFDGRFLDGLGATFLPDAQHELLLQATVRFCRVPDVVGLKKGAATQAVTAAECAAKVSTKKTKKKKKRGKVLRQEPEADSTVPPGGEVEIFIGSKAKKKKK
jgi:PASTA domain